MNSGADKQTVSEEQIRDAVALATDFLIGAALGAGCWTDFELPVGSSDEWVSAYIVSSLAASSHLGPVAQPVSWIVSRYRRNLGWGYNKSVPPDADSTAWSILALTRSGVELPDGAATALLSFQKPDGSFSTYQESTYAHGWSEPHADVTAICLLAMIESPNSFTEAAIHSTAEALVRLQRESGRWESYWWNTDLYATAHAARALSRTQELLARAESVDRRALLRRRIRSSLKSAKSHYRTLPEPFSIFALAHWLRLGNVISTSECAGASKASLSRLLQAQRSDGSWPAQPMLCLTDPYASQPNAAEARTRTFGDSGNLFTTASVISALSEMLLPSGHSAKRDV